MGEVEDMVAMEAVILFRIQRMGAWCLRGFLVLFFYFVVVSVVTGVRYI